MSDLLNELHRNNVRFIRVTWVDFSNITRNRILPIAYFRNIIESSESTDEDTVTKNLAVGKLKINGKPGITLPHAALAIVNLSMAEGVLPVGECTYTFDTSSARTLGFAPGQAIIFGWFEHKEIPTTIPTFAHPLCPRGILRRIVGEAKKSDDIDFLIGFETEVIFLKSTDPIEAVNDYGWSESPALLAGSAEFKALDEIANALEAAGIELQMYHAEAAPGQYEIVTGPLPPLQACDALVTTREIIMNVTAKHGLRATLAPRVFATSCGTAAHAHISLRSGTWPKTRSPVPVSGGPEVYLTELETTFLAGMLAHLPAATLFTMPTRASYARMLDGVWSGGTYVCWGRDHKEVPIRLTGRVDAGVSDSLKGPRFEVKCNDGTSCPYIAMAALLASGMIGIRRKAQLTVHGIQEQANTLSAEQLKKYKRMPLNLEEARDHLAKDEELRSALGSEFISRFLAVNKNLDGQLAAPSEVEAMTKLVRMY